METRISIIVATYNSARTLRRCLDSIVPQMDDRCDLYIMDGESKDDTVQIASSCDSKNIHIFSEPDRGVYDAWNKAISRIQDGFVTFIGSDDQLMPGTIGKYREFFREHGEDYDLVCGKLLFVNKDGVVIRRVGEPWDWTRHARRLLDFAHPGMLHNMRLFKKYGMFDLRYRICADSDFLLRIGPDTRAGFIDKYLVRMSQGGMSDGMRAMKEGYLIRKNNKSMPYMLNVWQHVCLLFRFYGGRVKRMIIN